MSKPGQVGEPPQGCSLCPRLSGFLADLRKKYPDWHNAPVPSFGDPSAELLIIGLAPGMHGANRTGRPFTGDWAGDLLYDAIDRHGFSTGQYKADPNDGLELQHAMITNAVRCLPPQNKPVGTEVNTCRQFLTQQIESMPTLKALLTLGKISHDSTVRALGLKLKDYPFGHHKIYDLPNGLRLYSSYHCSRYNTNTKRLTEDMFMAVFADIQGYLAK